jgi:hypothetical protein
MIDMNGAMSSGLEACKNSAVCPTHKLCTDKIFKDIKD